MYPPVRQLGGFISIDAEERRTKAWNARRDRRAARRRRAADLQMSTGPWSPAIDRRSPDRGQSLLAACIALVLTVGLATVYAVFVATS
jgi:hypothetical protein